MSNAGLRDLVRLSMKIPKAVRVYMEEAEETELATRQYIITQLRFYQEVPERAGSSPERWIDQCLFITLTIPRKQRRNYNRSARTVIG